MKPFTGLALAALAALLTGCGGGGGGGSSTVAASTPSAATTAVQVNLGDAATMHRGQRVAAFSNGAMVQGGGMHGMTGGGSLAASSVQLMPQGLRGTASGYAAHGTQATFTLTVAAESAFATLTGSRSVTVYQQPGTRMAQSIADDATVIAGGLLFFDNGTYALVATRIAGS